LFFWGESKPLHGITVRLWPSVTWDLLWPAQQAAPHDGDRKRDGHGGIRGDLI